MPKSSVGCMVSPSWSPCEQVSGQKPHQTWLLPRSMPTLLMGHTSQPVRFAPVIVNFAIKYVRHDHALHLLATLKEHCKCPSSGLPPSAVES